MNKLLIGVSAYFFMLALFLTFMRGATKMANEYEERQEILKYIEELKKQKKRR